MRVHLEATATRSSDAAERACASDTGYPLLSRGLRSPSPPACGGRERGPVAPATGRVSWATPPCACCAPTSPRLSPPRGAEREISEGLRGFGNATLALHPDAGIDQGEQDIGKQGADNGQKRIDQ